MSNEKCLSKVVYIVYFLVANILVGLFRPNISIISCEGEEGGGGDGDRQVGEQG